MSIIRDRPRPHRGRRRLDIAKRNELHRLGSAQALDSRASLTWISPRGCSRHRGQRPSSGGIKSGATSASTCLEAIPYALVIADWFLPDGNGIVVADAAAELGAKTLIISDLVFQLPGGVAGAHQLLPKRVGATEIVAAVQRMIGKPMVEPECPERRNGVP